MSVNSTINRKAKKCNSYVSDSRVDIPFIARVRYLVIRSNRKISQDLCNTRGKQHKGQVLALTFLKGKKALCKGF